MKSLTTEQVIAYMENLGSCPPIMGNDGILIFQSICHNSDSKKLYYYIDTYSFYCFKEQEKFNIYSLTMHCLGLEFKEAYLYVKNFFNITGYAVTNTDRLGFGNSYSKNDWDFFERYGEEESVATEKEEEEILNRNILSYYTDFYYDGWVNSHITVESMKKFDIKYDIMGNCIVIPHYNAFYELVGIRGRFLDVDSYAKYMPLTLEGQSFNHGLTNHLYGLWRNKYNIQSLEKVLIVEGEKSVMQAESYFPDNSFVVACCGQHISNAHVRLLLDLGVREVQLGFDSDFIKIGDNVRYLTYRKGILKKARKLIPYFRVYNVGAYNDKTIYYKCSPTDMGKGQLLDMMANKEWLCEEQIETELAEIETKLKELRTY